MTGKCNKGNVIAYGDYALVAESPAWITSNQIEAARIAMTRFIKRGGKVWIDIFPHKPVTKKPAETRMGSGKGSVEYWVAVVKPGRVMFEMGGVDVGVLRHLRDGGREFGRIVLRVVVPELENLPVDRRLRLGVDGPEHDPVVVGPPDRFAVFVQFGAGLRPGPNPDLRARAYRNFDGTCCGFRVCCGSLGA